MSRNRRIGNALQSLGRAVSGTSGARPTRARRAPGTPPAGGARGVTGAGVPRSGRGLLHRLLH